MYCTALHCAENVRYSTEQRRAQRSTTHGTARHGMCFRKREREREKRRKGEERERPEPKRTQPNRNEETRREERRSRGAGDGDAEAKARRRGEERSGERRERLIAAPIKRSRYASARPPLVSVRTVSERFAMSRALAIATSTAAVRCGTAQHRTRQQSAAAQLCREPAAGCCCCCLRYVPVRRVPDPMRRDATRLDSARRDPT